jgi:hypothetical protein
MGSLRLLTERMSDRLIVDRAVQIGGSSRYVENPRILDW